MKTENNIIDLDDEGIVAKETPVKLSDEKLRGMLSRVYERAVSDMGKMSFRKSYGTFLTISGTLLLALLTSDFRPIAGVSGDCVTLVAWAVLIVCFVIGMALLLYTVKKKASIDTSARDKAVEDVFREHCEK